MHTRFEERLNSISKIDLMNMIAGMPSGSTAENDRMVSCLQAVARTAGRPTQRGGMRVSPDVNAVHPAEGSLLEFI